MVSKLNSSGPTWVNRWEVISDTSGEAYTVAQKTDGSWGCSCPRWKFSKAPKQACKHILRVQEVESPALARQPRTNISRPWETSAPRAKQVPAPPTGSVPMFFTQTRRSIRISD